MECFDAVSSKYGLKTFDKPFGPDCKGVGRITKILPGTYENCCAYAHGSLFGALAMFEIGESRRAWEEICKTAVITHENCTMTTFVMPNSYCENKEFNIEDRRGTGGCTDANGKKASAAAEYGMNIIHLNGA